MLRAKLNDWPISLVRLAPCSRARLFHDLRGPRDAFSCFFRWLHTCLLTLNPTDTPRLSAPSLHSPSFPNFCDQAHASTSVKPDRESARTSRISGDTPSSCDRPRARSRLSGTPTLACDHCARMRNVCYQPGTKPIPLWERGMTVGKRGRG